MAGTDTIIAKTKNALDKNTIDGRKITVPVTVMICVLVGILPAAGLWSVAMYRLGNNEAATEKNAERIETNDKRIDKHDIEINRNHTNEENNEKLFNKIDKKLDELLREMRQR